MTNNSVFPVTVSFSFLHGGYGVFSHIAPPGEAPPPPPLAEGEEPPEPLPPPERAANPPLVFFTTPTTLTLEPDGTLDLLLSAFPECDGRFEEQLICTIADNPQPIVFPISAIGATPVLALDTQFIEFERLMLRRSDYKTLTLYSRSALPLRWAIKAEDLLEVTWGGEEGEPGTEDFTLAPTTGLLLPGDQASIRIGFHARSSKMLNRKFTIEVFDAAEPSVLGVVQSLQVELVAEAYSIDVDVTWPEEGVEGLDFKAFKVVDEQRSEMTLHNNGKYEVGYKVLMRKRPVKDVLVFTPPEGTLAPGATQKLEVWS